MAGSLLDTNVISELVRPRPDDDAMEWLASQLADDLHLSAMICGELVRGARRLAADRKRRLYERWIDRDLVRQFEGRVLAFDREAAAIWGAIMDDGDRLVRPNSHADAQIAATARRHGLSLVTRNTNDFEGMNVALLSPRERA